MRQFSLKDLTYPQLEEFMGKLEIKQAWFSLNVASVPTALIAAVTGKRLVIHGMIAACLSAGNFMLQSGTTDVFPIFSFAANAQILIPYSPVGWAQVSHGVAVNGFSNAANTVTGVILYSEND